MAGISPAGALIFTQMATMYETIMDLPLFKGVGKDHVSSFLEKTNISFINYAPDDIIVKPGDSSSMLRYVISGSVCIAYQNRLDGLMVTSVGGKGTLIGAERLFGIYTRSYGAVRALDEVSIMAFSKEQYVNLLNTDSIYQINFYNYLSLRCQRRISAQLEYSHDTLIGRLAIIVSSLTEAEASAITVELPVKELQQLTHDGDGREINMLVKDRIISVDGTKFRINDRFRLLDEAARNKYASSRR